MQERVKGNEKERRMGRRGGGRVFEGCKISANTVLNFSKGREREGDKREKREGGDRLRRERGGLRLVLQCRVRSK